MRLIRQFFETLWEMMALIAKALFFLFLLCAPPVGWLVLLLWDPWRKRATS
jgi:hypothetical protein